MLAGAFLIGFLTVFGSRLVWLNNDNAIEAYLKSKIVISYEYVVLRKIEKAPYGPHPISGYIAPEDGSFFRRFIICASDPTTTPGRSNIAVFGYVTANGNIRVCAYGNSTLWGIP